MDAELEASFLEGTKKHIIQEDTLWVFFSLPFQPLLNGEGKGILVISII